MSVVDARRRGGGRGGGVSLLAAVAAAPVAAMVVLATCASSVEAFSIAGTPVGLRRYPCLFMSVCLVCVLAWTWYLLPLAFFQHA